MRGMVVVLAAVAVLVLVWTGVRGLILSLPSPDSVGPTRAYCDTGRGVFLPCAAVEPETAAT